MKIGLLTSDRLKVFLKITIICVSCSTIFVESAALYPREKKSQSYYEYILKNREKSLNENINDGREYDGALTYRDFFQNNYANDNAKYENIRSRNHMRYPSKNQITRSFGNHGEGLTRILTFPLKNNDNQIIGPIKNFEPGNPGADCLAGGVDAGVVNGALKIGIGLGLAPGCGTSTEHTPKMVPVPVLVPRPFPVPVGVPQPYPIAVDVPRPVAIRVPQPVPFPAFNTGPMPIMGPMQNFPSPSMTSSDCLFQNCIIPPGFSQAGIKRNMNVKNRRNGKIPEYRKKMTIPRATIFRNFHILTNRTN